MRRWCKQTAEHPGRHFFVYFARVSLNLNPADNQTDASPYTGVPLFVYSLVPTAAAVFECITYTPDHPTPIGFGNHVW